MDVLEFKANVKGRWKVIENKNKKEILECEIKEHVEKRKKTYYLIGLSIAFAGISFAIWYWKRNEIKTWIDETIQSIKNEKNMIE